MVQSRTGADRSRRGRGAGRIGASEPRAESAARRARRVDGARPWRPGSSWSASLETGRGYCEAADDAAEIRPWRWLLALKSGGRVLSPGGVAVRGRWPVVELGLKADHRRSRADGPPSFPIAATARHMGGRAVPMDD